MELEAGEIVEEMERGGIGLGVLEAAAWMLGAGQKLCLTPCQADRAPQT